MCCIYCNTFISNVSIPFFNLFLGVDTLKTYFERIKELRISKHLTQKDVSNYINITTNAYQKYEYGTRKPDIDIFIKLADYFDVSLDYLLGRTDNPHINK